MPPLSLLIKPASGNCNLRCKYCFYHSIAESRSVASYGIMDLPMLETIVKKSLEFADKQCTFAFQGGEPTLAGLGFYKKLIEYEKKYNFKKVNIQNVIQTNGLVINDEWAQFLSSNRFLVGISLDGPKDIHDENRVGSGNSGSFNKVMKAIELFNKYNVEYNILSVVTAHSARHISKIYNFYKKNNFNYLQFIPCLDPLGEKPGNQKYSLTPERYGSFLKNLFNLWHQDIMTGNGISIRYFDNLVGMLLGYAPESCDMKGHCSCQFVIEAKGGVYPCDFYVIDEWYLGNIAEMGFADLRESPNAKKFVKASKHIDNKCMQCKWFSLCRGGCRRTREPFEDGKPVLNYFCPSFMNFFEYAGSRLQEIARMLSGRFL